MAVNPIEVAKQNLEKAKETPVYADEVMVAVQFKASRRKEGKKEKIEKEAHVNLFFVDMFTKRPVARVVLSRFTAQGLWKVLGDNLANIDKEMSSDKLPQASVVAAKKAGAEQERYIG